MPLVEYFLAVMQDGDYLNDWSTHFPSPIEQWVQYVGYILTVLFGR